MKQADTLNSHRAEQAYRLRIQLSLAATLLLVILVVHWWPVSDTSGSWHEGAATYGEEIFTIEEILPTRHIREQKLPPAPLPPLVEPAEVIFEELDLWGIDSLLIVEARVTGPDAAHGSLLEWTEGRGLLEGAGRGKGHRKRRPRCVCENQD